MSFLIAFSPFITFAVLERFIGVPAALAAAAVLSLAIELRDALSKDRHVKLLELGSLLLFGGLGVLALATKADWPVLQVRLWVDAGLCAIVLASVVIGRPFTLAYAKERVPAEVWGTERIFKTNRTISLAWAAAFLVIVLADVLMLYVPEISLRIGIGLTIVSLVAAFKFSNWYPAQLARRTS